MGNRRLPKQRALLESLLIGAGGLLAVGVGVLGLWFFATGSIRENFRHHLVTLAQVAALQVDPALHGQLRDPAQRNGPLYDRVIAPLLQLRGASAEIRYIFTMVLDGETIRFVVDTGSPQIHAETGRDDQAGVWEAYTDADADMFRIMRGEIVGDEASTEEPIVDSWGSFMTGFAPVFDSQHRRAGVVGVAVRAEDYVARLDAARRWALLGILPSVLLLVVFTFIYYRQRLRGLDSAARLATEQARLHDSEGRFRSLFELSPVGIALNDLSSGRFLQVNDALSQSSGYSREELLETTFSELLSEDLTVDEAAWTQGVSPTKHYGPYEREHVRKDGSRCPVLLSGIRLTDVHGQQVLWSIVQDISERKAYEQDLADAARRDKLTGLANRARFMERLEQEVARRNGGEDHLFAVLFLDFDRFKTVNDSLGHEAGDELLRQIAQRLRMALCAGGTPDAESRTTLIARFGGDEFLVLVSELPDGAFAARVAERLHEALTPGYTIHGHSVHSSASIGIVTCDQCQADADMIVCSADAAMYEAKRTGAARSAVFTQSMRVQLTRRVTIESELRAAIGTSQLSLAYQPIIELETGQMASVEALLCWNHPSLGAISPSEFVPVAEDSGLVVALGQWVLHQACHMLAGWRARDPAGAPLSVSVNMSRAELRQGQRLLERVRETLASTGLPASCLQLEVTEREVMRDPEAAFSLLRELRELGVRLAMDNFGTGSSSLACLRSYPFDVVKIDRSFMQDLSDSPDVIAVMHATISLIENLAKTSVAEGVESAAQVAVLQSLGCRYAQGHFFSRPMNAEQLIAGAERVGMISATA